MKKLIYAVLVCSLICLILTGNLMAGNIDIPLDSPIYPQLERLKSIGAIKAPLPALKPYNTEEVENIIDDIDPSLYYIKDLLQKELNRYKHSGVNEVYINSIYSSDEGIVVPNKEGLILKDGLNLNAKVSMQLIGRRIGIALVPEYRSYHNSVYVNNGYIRYTWKNLNITLGKESLWMGQGREGTLLLSNNAESLEMVRISSLRPFAFNPYYHKLLYKIFGFMDIDFFVGRLGEYDRIKREDGTISSGHPKLLGMQITFRPLNLFEIGLYRTAMFGGGGRDEGLKTFGKALFPFGQAENTGTPDEPGDQIAGYTFNWYVPNKYQPFRVYAELAGEDSAGNLPYKYSALAGILLSDTLGVKGLQCSYEYLYMDIDNCNCWYRHHIYLRGYTNKDIVMGHYNGGSGKGGILRLRYLRDLDSDYTIAWQHYEGEKDNIDSLILGLRHRFKNNIEYQVDTNLSDKASWISMTLKWIFD